MKARLLVDGPEFWAALRRDIASARRRVLVQAMTFEGDSVGRALARGLLASPATDRRLLVDAYSRAIVSDRFVFAPANLSDRRLQTEACYTRRLLHRLQNQGVAVRTSNPLGWLWRKLPARNHKKIMVIDGEIAYIGGINFSEHNFAWHDCMLRIESPDIADFLAGDFEATWGGENQCQRRDFGSLEIALLDGRSNDRSYSAVTDAIGQAREEIWIQSPYLSFPFFEHLGRARQRGVEVTLLAPEHNNWGLFNAYSRQEAARCGIRLLLYPDRLTHLKAMLIDGTTLILGSANYDYFSYRRHQEVLLLIRDEDIIREFRERVADPDTRTCHRFNPSRAPGTGHVRRLPVELLLRLAVLAAAGRSSTGIPLSA
ncbi:MAG: phosphatidylserine/phosphatidylglycerophosphate/cardiolipin synthase family protein [Gammaproteobacteria bacterium]|jgi:cardiolipin synthase|nr:phosphatidylserine/phosphatidylglycerophosphate/cardiolipin synthase family protein [Gammaproteobacteria bacterium]